MTAPPPPLDEARRLVLAAVRPPVVEHVPLTGAGGRYLAETIVASTLQPPADLAAMDGYAVRSAELTAATADEPVWLTVSGVSRAGGPFGGVVEPGQAVRIFTGAEVPAGADAVVVQEACRAEGNRIAARSAVAPGANICPAGEEFVPGDPLLTVGTRLTPPAVGLLAVAGRTTIAVGRRPRVAVVSLGDELLEPRAGRADANGPMLLAAAAELGLTAELRGPVVDEVEAVADALRPLLADWDVVLTTGGASVGERDVVGEVWTRLGVRSLFDQVALRPGKPTHAGVAGETLVFALPGNPLAALTAFRELVVPALIASQGGAPPEPARVRLPVADATHLKRAARYLIQCPWPGPAGLELPERQGAARLRPAASATLVADLMGPAHLGAGWPLEARAIDLAGRCLRPAPPLPAVVIVSGPSDSGKTCLVEALVAEWTRRGRRVGTIKHASCAIAVDRPGKDTARHAAAGARRTLLIGPEQAAWLIHDRVDPRLGPWLELFAGEVDLVCVEGFHAEPAPRVKLAVGPDWALERRREMGFRQWLLTRPEGPWPGLPDDLRQILAGEILSEVGG